VSISLPTAMMQALDGDTGYLVIWLSGHLVIWSFDYLVIWAIQLASYLVN
jgi:hypothetical protein